MNDEKGFGIVLLYNILDFHDILVAADADQDFPGAAGIHSGTGNAGDAAAQIIQNAPGNFIGAVGDDHGAFGGAALRENPVRDFTHDEDRNQGIKGVLDIEDHGTEDYDNAVEELYEPADAVLTEIAVKCVPQHVGAAGGCTGHQKKAGSDAEADAAVDGDKKQVSGDQIVLRENCKLRGNDQPGEAGAHNAAEALRLPGKQEDRNVHQKVGYPQRDLQGRVLSGEILDDDGQTGNTAGDKAGGVEEVFGCNGGHGTSDQNQKYVSGSKL